MMRGEWGVGSGCGGPKQVHIAGGVGDEARRWVWPRGEVQEHLALCLAEELEPDRVKGHCGFKLGK